MPHKKIRHNDHSHTNKLATDSPCDSSRWLKNISAVGVTTVLSAGILVACGQMSSAESNASSTTKSAKQNSGVTSSRDMLPSDMLGQMRALPQLTKGLGDTGSSH